MLWNKVISSVFYKKRHKTLCSMKRWAQNQQIFSFTSYMTKKSNKSSRLTCWNNKVLIPRLRNEHFTWWRRFPSGLTCLSLSPCRGPVSPHTSMETRLMSQLELRDSCHTTAAYKNSVPNKQTNDELRWIKLTSTASATEDKDDEEKKKKKKKNSAWRKKEKKNSSEILKKNDKYSLSSPRVLVQHLSSFTETSHADFMVHLKDDWLCNKSFRRYSIRSWKMHNIWQWLLLLPSLRYCYCYLKLNKCVRVCVCCFRLELLSYLTRGSIVRTGHRQCM